MIVYAISESIQLLILTGQYVYKGLSYFWTPKQENMEDMVEMGRRLQLVEDRLEMIALLEKYDIKIRD
jgi:hypothetical protein